MEALALNTRNTDWILIIMSLAGMSLVLARFISPVRVNNFLRLPAYVKGREMASGFNPIQSKRAVDLLLSFCGILVVALAIFFVKAILSQGGIAANGWQDYLRILFFIALFLLFKSLIGAMLGSVFGVIKTIIEAQNQLFAYLSWLLVPLFPLLLGGVYISGWQNLAAYIAMVVLAAGLVLAILQSAVTIIKLPPSIGYNIFYLCALELTPVVYLILIIQNI